VTAGYARAVRSPGLAVVIAALLAAGCGHPERKVSAKDRTMCERSARRVARPGSDRYKGTYKVCIYNVQHPERAGG
jgi:hypothetical protein